MSDVLRIPTQWSYSAAVAFDRLVFIGLHPGAGNDFATQLRSSMASIRETLCKVGADLSDIVKVNVWLKRISDLPEMEKLFFEFFEQGGFPARMTSTTEFINDDCLIMIDGTAIRSSSAIKTHGNTSELR